MAEKVSVRNYENMISALSAASKNIYDDASQLVHYASICASALGDSDNAVPQIIQRVAEARQKYAECVETAMNIARAMQEELEEMRKENDVWGDD